MRKAIIVIPTYNESKNIEKLIEQIYENTKTINNWEFGILIVDSESPDKTEEVIKRLQLKYPELYMISTKKEGLGKAYMNGFQYAINHFQPYVLFEMDADLSHDPTKIPEFLKLIENGADFVLGSRYIKGGSIPADWGLQRKLFSIVGNLIVRFGFMKLKVTDWTTGYRAIKVWIIKSALHHVKSYSGYVFQIAMLDFAIKKNAIIKEVPFHFVDRKYGVSKINSGQYIVQILTYVFTNSSFIKFVIVGFIGFFIDFGISYLMIEKVKASVWFATIIATESAIIMNFILNNFWSFSYKQIQGGLISYIFNFFKFNFVSAGSIIIQTLGMTILTATVGKQYWYIYKVLIIAFIIIPYSYILYNKVVWKEK